jgi:hypothetical protein
MVLVIGEKIKKLAATLRTQVTTLKRFERPEALGVFLYSPIISPGVFSP